MPESVALELAATAQGLPLLGLLRSEPPVTVESTKPWILRRCDRGTRVVMPATTWVLTVAELLAGTVSVSLAATLALSDKVPAAEVVTRISTFAVAVFSMEPRLQVTVEVPEQLQVSNLGPRHEEAAESLMVVLGLEFGAMSVDQE